MLEALNQELRKRFDTVERMSTQSFAELSKAQNKPLPPEGYPTLFVVGLAYPKRILKPVQGSFVPSFYCFGTDYHLVLKSRLEEAVQAFPVKYQLGVDNHPWDERLAAVHAGIGFFGKHQLIIHETLGSYFFLGLLFVDIPFVESSQKPVEDGCGECRKCIDACPTNALSEAGYEMSRCLSFLNQSKQPLSKLDAMANYCLFGCDLCQLACPKNKSAGTVLHPEFAHEEADIVRAEDLYSLSERAFEAKYPKKAFLWKGKTVLMRNGALLLWKKNDHAFDDLLKTSLSNKPAWYQATVTAFLNDVDSSNHPAKENL
jgi:epoxyqueuosine reductase